MKRRVVVFGFIGILSILIGIMFASDRTRRQVEARTRLEPITAWLHDWDYVDNGFLHERLLYKTNHLDADYIVVQNNRAFPVAIGGWDVRSSDSPGTGLCQYVIPSDRTIAPFSDVYIWATSGHDDGMNLYAGCSFDRWPAVYVCLGGEYPHIITTLGMDMRVVQGQPPKRFFLYTFYEIPCGLK